MVWLWRKFWWLWFCSAPSYVFLLLLKKALDNKFPGLECQCWPVIQANDLSNESAPGGKSYSGFALLISTPSLTQNPSFTFLPSFKFFPHLRDDFTFLRLLCLLLPSARDSFSYCQMSVTHFWFIFHFLLSLHVSSQPSLHRVWWPLKLQTTSSQHNSVSSCHMVPVRVPTHPFLHSTLWPLILFLLELVVEQKALVSHSSLDSLL